MFRVRLALVQFRLVLFNLSHQSLERYAEKSVMMKNIPAKKTSLKLWPTVCWASCSDRDLLSVCSGWVFSCFSVVSSIQRIRPEWLSLYCCSTEPTISRSACLQETQIKMFSSGANKPFKPHIPVSTFPICILPTRQRAHRVSICLRIPVHLSVSCWAFSW